MRLGHAAAERIELLRPAEAEIVDIANPDDERRFRSAFEVRALRLPVEIGRDGLRRHDREVGENGQRDEDMSSVHVDIRSGRKRAAGERFGPLHNTLPGGGFKTEGGIRMPPWLAQATLRGARCLVNARIASAPRPAPPAASKDSPDDSGLLPEPVVTQHAIDRLSKPVRRDVFLRKAEPRAKPFDPPADDLLLAHLGHDHDGHTVRRDSRSRCSCRRA